MDESQSTCLICRGAESDAALDRVQVWEDARWRLTVSLVAEVPGFAYLEPKRHIANITDLDGEEVHTFGVVLARVTRALKIETNSELVYVYIFGDGVPHLHVHLAPHRAGDALNNVMIKGEIISERIDSGAERLISRQFPPLPEDQQRAVAHRVAQRLAAPKPG